MYPEIPVLCFIAAALSLLPLISYLQARNIAAMAIGIWLSITNVTYVVDALVWAKNADVKAPVWCDISTSVITGSRIALPAACLSISMHLERLASFCQTSTLRAKQQRIIFECLMCFGLPVLYIALHLIVQSRRFDLFYGFGCRPATYPTVTAIFSVMVPPLLLTAATIVCAGMAWRHFLVHGVKFDGRKKRGSISPLARNQYLRLIGMALFEALCSAALVIIVTWGVLSPGLAPIGNMPRNLSEALAWDSEAITYAHWAGLETEWLLTVVQSVVFFGLFATRVDVAREGWELVCRFPQSLRTLNVSVMPRRDTSEQSLTSGSIGAISLPLTEVDLSLVIRSASTLTPVTLLTDKSLPSIPRPLGHPCVIEDAQEDVAMKPLELPSRASVFASSHNSLESNLDPSRIGFSPYAWPQTPTAIPRCSFSLGYDYEEFEESLSVPFPRAKVATHVRSPTGNISGHLPMYEPENRPHAVYLTVVRET